MFQYTIAFMSLVSFSRSNSNMAIQFGPAEKFCKSLLSLCYSRFLSATFHSIPASHTLEESIKAAVETEAYEQIPDLLSTPTTIPPQQKSNPFSFLSSFPDHLRTKVIDKILQSFLHLRPRSRTRTAYEYLLSHTLANPNPLPLALAIIQRILRSGCTPVPQTHLSLSSAWLDHHQTQSVADILNDMRSIGYHPDCNTCNYLLSSLCTVDHSAEAIRVLKGMGGAGCNPDSESYGTVIGVMCKARKTGDVAELMSEMVTKFGLMPRQGIVIKAVAAMRANREMVRAVEMIELLEKEGCSIGFEAYEMVVKGCLERREFILAGKVVMEMAERGFIPYIRVRQRVVGGLASVGEGALASVVRQRFADLNS
ncbi:pentatricopeptide repeat-containing protein At1g06270 [Telopea speciosissima]|uniref:pentatricopeptide repeat-containing protein At1g06270 n=1 Tax=Telopea speciosissima TaxID=54955 RepID=UPI001CC3F4A9|nr:pentatricopeptide repeat-containing protein At1g06270 [Telopea speciosissima]